MVEHAELLCADGQQHGIRDFRKHTGWYLKGFPAGGEMGASQPGRFLEEMRELIGSLDRETPFPDGGMRMVRGHSGSPKDVHLPEGWLDDRDDEVCVAEGRRTARQRRLTRRGPASISSLPLRDGPHSPWRRSRTDDEPDRRLHESGGPAGGTRRLHRPFENMPGAQNQPFGATPPKAFVPAIGLTVRIGPGPDAAWLGTDSVTGIVCDIVPGQLHEATTVVKLEHPVDGVGRTGRTVTGDYLVLEPAGSPSRWRRTEPPTSRCGPSPVVGAVARTRGGRLGRRCRALRIRLSQLHVRHVPGRTSASAPIRRSRCRTTPPCTINR